MHPNWCFKGGLKFRVEYAKWLRVEDASWLMRMKDRGIGHENEKQMRISQTDF